MCSMQSWHEVLRQACSLLSRQHWVYAGELDKQYKVLLAMVQQSKYIKETCFRRREQCMTV